MRRIARSKGQDARYGLEHSPTPSREVGMTRTDVVASSRPQKADEATMRKGSPRARKLVVLSVAFALMMALVSPAAVFAAEETSPYTSKPPTTTTTSTPPPTTTAATPAPTPTSGTSPEKQ